MPPVRGLLLILLLCAAAGRAGAVEVFVSGTGTYNTTDPLTQIANWNSGWGASGITGWNYVGQIGDASGVYLGNDWVLTAGHVGAGNFTLDGTTYDVAPNSAQSFSNSYGTADLTLFELATGPDLPALTIDGNAPTPLSDTQAGAAVAMIGYGGGNGETWGLDTVTANNIDVSIEGASYQTIDFETAFGITTSGTGTPSMSATNNATLVGGDSGGGDFIYNTFTHKWMLAGINEAINPDTGDSYMIQLGAYASQIRPLTAVPEPRVLLLAPLALLLLLPRLRPRRLRAQ